MNFQSERYPEGPKVVALGGGTGLSTLLRGLKRYTDNITAIVAVTDTGGSSGRLRLDLGMLPPGDIRNCLMALANTEPLIERLFQYRFPEESDLVGHNFGNLFLATMCEVVGDFECAIRETSRVLKVRGRVLPATLTNATLVAEYVDGALAHGETSIVGRKVPIHRVSLDPPNCQPVPDALTAIAQADIIVMGPGSLYTSVLPNLLVQGIPEAIAASPAIKVYVVNVMTQPGETDGYTAADHVQAVIEHGGRQIVDWALVNSKRPTANTLARYREEGAEPVLANSEELERFGIHIKEGSLLSVNDMARHDPGKLAETVLKLLT